MNHSVACWALINKVNMSDQTAFTNYKNIMKHTKMSFRSQTYKLLLLYNNYYYY